MSEFLAPLKDDRPGNEYPVIVDDRQAPDRESILFSYANTVENCYAGDFRIYAKRFGDYLRDSKSKVYDLAKNEFLDVPIRYAAPQQAFADNMMPGSTGSVSEGSLTDRVKLPLVSYYISGTKRDEKRAIDPVVRYRYKPKKLGEYSKALVTHSPIPIDYSIQVDIWVEFREHLHQLITAFHNDFNPISYLTDLYDVTDETQKLWYTPYVAMELESINDSSNFIPGTDRRVVRGTVRINIKGWLTPTVHEESYIHKVVAVNNAINLSETDTLTPTGNGIFTTTSDEMNKLDITSFKGRIGPVIPQTGDYDASQITINGTNVASVLNSLVGQLTVVLGEDMPAYTFYRIDAGKAVKVTSLYTKAPLIDGITLIPGKIGESVAVGNPGKSYQGVTTFDKSAPLFLSQTGSFTPVRPFATNGDKYLLVIGHSNENSNLFLLNPGTPIKLSN